MSNDDFKFARDFLLALGDNYPAAKAGFVWPRLERFNWALDWFDDELASGEHGARPALKILGDEASRPIRSPNSREALLRARQRPARARRRARRPAAADARQCRAAVDLDAGGDEARPGRRSPRRRSSPAPTSTIGSRAAARASSSPTAPTPANSPGAARAPSASPSARRRRAGATTPRCSTPARISSRTARRAPTIPLLLYFTSGTTARPKLVLHSHASYPDRPSLDDVRPRPASPATRISTFPRPAGPSTPGRASSRRGTPGLASSRSARRFDARATLDDLVAHRGRPRSARRRRSGASSSSSISSNGRSRCAKSAPSGEPLNPEVIEQRAPRLGPDACAIPTARRRRR